MLIKIGRYLLLILVVIIMSIYLPYFYWISFSERIRPPYVQYSPIIDNFVILDYKNDKFYDADKNEYKREEVDQLLPLAHYRLLATKGLLPDSVRGIKLDIDEIRLNYIDFRIKPENINPPQIDLFPLMESKPERLRLEIPNEFYRTKNRIEFITSESNVIDDELTGTFTETMLEQGFQFPGIKHFGNPTTRKAYDEGYFILDSNHQLFHLKKIEGKPFCKKVDSVSDIKIKTFFVREFSLKEFYGFIVTEDNRLFLLLFDSYKLQEIPIQNYDPEEDILRFQGNIFFRIVTIYKENQLNVYVTDREYNLIDVYSDSWQGRDERLAGLISSYIFPFNILLVSSDSQFVDFYFSEFSISSIYISILLIIISLIWLRRNKLSVSKNIFDLILILLTGIYGFIGVHVFRDN